MPRPLGLPTPHALWSPGNVEAIYLSKLVKTPASFLIRSWPHTTWRMARLDLEEFDLPYGRFDFCPFDLGLENFQMWNLQIMLPMNQDAEAQLGDDNVFAKIVHRQMIMLVTKGCLVSLLRRIGSPLLV